MTSVKLTFANPIAERLINRTKGFPFLTKVKNAHINEHDIISSIRCYYILIPHAGYDNKEWLRWNRTRRRQVISNHLEKVCEKDKIQETHIQQIDFWMTTRLARSSGLLEKYGRELEKKYGNICFYCGQKIVSNRTVDHIFPYSKGGEDTIDNFMLMHHECNSSKNDQVPGEATGWVNSNPLTTLDRIDKRLRFLVFLRDNFICQQLDCHKGIHSKNEISVKKKHETGLVSYDNLETCCINCKENSKINDN
jgi:5-methylcytosine-specific restriction endonuclease McrA